MTLVILPDAAGPKTSAAVGHLLGDLLRQHQAERHRLDRIAAWVRNKVNDIYVPRRVTSEFRTIVDQSRFNVLKLVETTVAQTLYVDGYRANGPSGRPADDGNAEVWSIWQANRMDSRQAAIWRPAIRFGWSYLQILPDSLTGTDVPSLRPYSPRRVTCLWDDPVNDEWPTSALVCQRPPHLSGLPIGGDPLDPSTAVDTMRFAPGAKVYVLDERYRYCCVRTQAGTWELQEEAEEHGLGVVPIVRFKDEEGDDDDDQVIASGKIEPLLPAQRQVNQISYQLAMALHYSAFRQRWATGMTIERDAAGNIIPSWNAAVDMVWQNSSTSGKFGDFAQTDVKGYLESRQAVLLFMAATGQIPPHNIVTGPSISNLSAEALAALSQARMADTVEHQKTFGESVEQAFRLAGLAAGNRAAWEDTDTEVRWADTTPRSLAQVADALVKLYQIEVPVEALWEMIPGTTDQRLATWRALRSEAQRQRSTQLDALMAETQAAVAAAGGDDEDQEDGDADGDAGDVAA